MLQARRHNNPTDLHSVSLYVQPAIRIDVHLCCCISSVHIIIVYKLQHVRPPKPYQHLRETSEIWPFLPSDSSSDGWSRHRKIDRRNHQFCQDVKTFHTNAKPNAPTVAVVLLIGRGRPKNYWISKSTPRRCSLLRCCVKWFKTPTWRHV